MRRILWVLFIVIPALAVLVTLLTGGVQNSTPLDYGFPLPWRSLAWLGCAPCPLGAQCCNPTSINWLFFILDVAFYSALGYAILLGCYSIVRHLNRFR